MRVILRKDVASLGRKGEEREVKPGYARNFLLPNGLALMTDDPAARQLREAVAAAGAKGEAEEAKVVELAASVDGKTVVIKTKVGAKGQLFAAIGEVEIKTAVKEQLKVEPRSVQGGPIKALGEHPVKLVFDLNEQAEITVKVEEAEMPAKGSKELKAKKAVASS